MRVNCLPRRAALQAAALAVPALLAAGVASLATPARAEVEAEPRTVVVTKADCLRLVKHTPRPDVEYRPGVDVHGDPVAPADLYGRPDLKLPEQVEIAIEVELDARFDLPEDARYEGDAKIGKVVVDLETGRAIFNGQPLTTRAEAELAARCRQRLRDGDR